MFQNSIASTQPSSLNPSTPPVTTCSPLPLPDPLTPVNLPTPSNSRIQPHYHHQQQQQHHNNPQHASDQGIAKVEPSPHLLLSDPFSTPPQPASATLLHPHCTPYLPTQPPTPALHEKHTCDAVTPSPSILLDIKSENDIGQVNSLLVTPRVVNTHNDVPLRDAAAGVAGVTVKLPPVMELAASSQTLPAVPLQRELQPPSAMATVVPPDVNHFSAPAATTTTNTKTTRTTPPTPGTSTSYPRNVNIRRSLRPLRSPPTPPQRDAASRGRLSQVALKEQRARRNRESAKRSRVKNKMYVEQLEMACFNVSCVNDSLRLLSESLMRMAVERSPQLREELRQLFDAEGPSSEDGTTS